MIFLLKVLWCRLPWCNSFRTLKATSQPSGFAAKYFSMAANPCFDGATEKAKKAPGRRDPRPEQTGSWKLDRPIWLTRQSTKSYAKPKKADSVAEERRRGKKISKTNGIHGSLSSYFLKPQKSWMIDQKKSANVPHNVRRTFFEVAFCLNHSVGVLSENLCSLGHVTQKSAINFSQQPEKSQKTVSVFPFW